jgi:hypothetical protein
MEEGREGGCSQVNEFTQMKDCIPALTTTLSLNKLLYDELNYVHLGSEKLDEERYKETGQDIDMIDADDTGARG